MLGDAVERVVGERRRTVADLALEGVERQSPGCAGALGGRGKSSACGVAVRGGAVVGQTVAGIVRSGGCSCLDAVAGVVPSVCGGGRAAGPGRHPAGLVVAVGVLPRACGSARRLLGEAVVEVVAVGGAGLLRCLVQVGDLVAREATEAVVGVVATGGGFVLRGACGLDRVLLEQGPACGVEVVPDVAVAEGVPDPVDPAAVVVPVVRLGFDAHPLGHVAVGVVAVADLSARAVGGEQLSSVVVGVRVPCEVVARAGGGDAARKVIGEGAVGGGGLRARAGLANEAAEAVEGTSALHAAGQQLGDVLARLVVDGRPGAVGKGWVGGGGGFDGGLGQVPGREGVRRGAVPAVSQPRAVARRVVAEGRRDGLGVRHGFDLLGDVPQCVVGVRGARLSAGDGGRPVAVGVVLRLRGTQHALACAVVRCGCDVAERVVCGSAPAVGRVGHLGLPAEPVVAEPGDAVDRVGHRGRLPRRVVRGGGGAACGGGGCGLVARVVPDVPRREVLQGRILLDSRRGQLTTELVVGGLSPGPCRVGG